MPETSVVCIAKNERELGDLKAALKRQTYRDFELVTSTKKGIPVAWNDAFSRAKGKYIVVTESDALPMNDEWLAQMVKSIRGKDEKTIIRGIEVPQLPWCFCNLVCHASLLKNNKLNEKYPIAEDTELFARLRKNGYKGLMLPIGPVFHKRRGKGFAKDVKNYYIYGRLLSKIFMQYGYVGFEEGDRGNVIKRELTTIFSRISYIFGLVVGFISFRFEIKTISDDDNDKHR
jgi:glycosyltransferase involved in cell wall biosynthesis